MEVVAMEEVSLDEVAVDVVVVDEVAIDVVVVNKSVVVVAIDVVVVVVFTWFSLLLIVTRMATHVIAAIIDTAVHARAYNLVINKPLIKFRFRFQNKFH